MRAAVRIAWRAAAAVAFGATAALAVTLTRGAPLHASLTSARNLASAGSHTDKGSTPRCAASRLDISIPAAGATSVTAARAGGGAPRLTVTRFPVEFTNISAAPCTLSGYPGVSAYRAGGVQVGNAAGLDASASALLIVLAPGASAHASVVDSAAGKRCLPVAATGLRVVPPGQSVPRYVRYKIAACSAAGSRAPVFLHVRALQYGTGVPGGARHHPGSRLA